MGADFFEGGRGGGVYTVDKGREEGGLLGEKKASENSRRPLATAPITPLVVQYFLRMKN